MPLIPMENNPLLSIRDFSLSFSSPDEPTVEVIRSLDLDIQSGKTFCLVGESGCGKSVTARAIMGLLDRNAEINRGQMNLHDANGGHLDLLSLRPRGKEMRAIRGRRIAMIFQEPMSSLSPVHTIGDQIDEAIILHEKLNRKQARKRTVDLLDRVGFSSPAERANSYAFELSGGLRQRAMIAMAISCAPELLIADEPTTALDVTIQAQILDLLLGLQDELGMAMLFITHDMGVVAEIADEVAVMYLGDVAEKGSVFDIFDLPKHPYTLALIQSVPKVVRTRDRKKFELIGGSVPHLIHRPAGCGFFNRCKHAMPICRDVLPKPTEFGPGHASRCHLHLAQDQEASL